MAVHLSKKDLELNEKNIFTLLEKLEKEKTTTIEIYNRRCKILYPDNDSGKIIDKLRNLEYIQIDPKTRQTKITKKGKNFVDKYNCKLKRDNINEHVKFLKNIKWVIVFLIYFI